MLSNPPRPINTRSTTFPTYLLPSIPFRSQRHKRRDSTSAVPSTPTSDTTPTTTTPAPASAPRSHSLYLSGHTSYLRCARCSTDLCLTSQIISKGFTGRHGRAYLVCPSSSSSFFSSTSPSPPGSGSNNNNGNNGNGGGGDNRTKDKNSIPAGALANVLIHKPVPRQLVTGAHTVSDISCVVCGTVLGWKYVGAEDEAQRYKVGKFILETRKVRAVGFWEEQVEEQESVLDVGSSLGEGSKGGGGAISVGLKSGKEESGVSGFSISQSVNNTHQSHHHHPPTNIKFSKGEGGSTPGQGRESNSREKDKDREREASEDIRFDSQDEDECEDLFAGVWSPALATMRRRRRRFGRGD